MLDANNIYLGDCLQLMKFIDDKSIDMILCDLPYGVTACFWDCIIPFDQLWTEYKRIIKDNGAIVLTATQPFTSALVMSNPKWFRCEWIWVKENGSNFMNYKYQPAKVHENIVVFSKEKTVYNPQKIMGKPYTRMKYGKLAEVYSGITMRIPTSNKSGLRFPKSILKFKSVKVLKERGFHPTQKPVDLFEYLIKTYSNPGDLVLDNCAGSGTTAIAAIRSQRRYILIEKEEKYYNICKERIANLEKEGQLNVL